ncbi:MAG: UDP-N-acetylmuramoyl-L-alanyl-D-glutamate--2,6-diaminopimelate ligase [bacterium]|nr:UDP-N-acetylmuramoyl-L-alanyl-D-glutamate--2,6-diaminopimelate ligase [bacterium]
MKSWLKKHIPQAWLIAYHKGLAVFAAFWYGHPSDNLFVIGVTGTNGKSTTVNLIADVLRATGEKVGLTSTVNFRIGDKEWLNDKKMTMLGRFALQRLLRDMVSAKCRYAVIETSSEGLAQFRHLGINYDVAVFLNLTPEHIESHGGFENYKAAKGNLFTHLMRFPKKSFDTTELPKTSVINLDSPHAEYFLAFPADQKIGFRTTGTNSVVADRIFDASALQATQDGCRFMVDGVPFELALLGGWNISNALAAISVGSVFGIPLQNMRDALARIPGIPGRMERIDEGQNFTVIVDYAPQPQAVEKVYEFIKLIPHERIIHVLGSTGGGRDKSRRPKLGALAGSAAQVVIVTNEDPYDDDPMEIINQVAEGAVQAGKRDGVDLFRILNRRTAIEKAIEMAQPNDLVLLTGKGSEQAIVTKNLQKVPWDERDEARRAIRARNEKV